MAGKKAETVGIRVDDKTRAKWESAALADSRVLSDWIRQVLDRWILGERPEVQFTKAERDRLRTIAMIEESRPGLAAVLVELGTRASVNEDLAKALRHLRAAVAALPTSLPSRGRRGRKARTAGSGGAGAESG